MDVRLTGEQRALRAAAARLADDLGPGSVQDLSDVDRVMRLGKAVDATGWRNLRSDGASGVEVAIVAEEFGRGLVDVPFLGPVLADELSRHNGDTGRWTIAVDGTAPDCLGIRQALTLDGNRILAGVVGEAVSGADLTRTSARLCDPLTPFHVVSADVAGRWRALALVTTCADLVGVSRGAHALACEYARIREQYGKPIGSYQAVSHMLAEGLALIEGSISVLRHAAWAVDELPSLEAIQAARIAKLYCVRAARTVCETTVQVHGGIGNTWDCMAHVYLRRALTSSALFPVHLKEIHSGLS